MRFFRRVTAFALLVLLLASFLPAFGVSAYSGSVTLPVGQTTTLYTNYRGSGALVSAMWSSNNNSAISITSSNASFCTIKAECASPVTVVVDCHYYYQEAVTVAGRTSYPLASGYTSYTVTITDSGSSSGGGSSVSGYRITPSSTSMNIDMANGPAELTITSGVPFSSDVTIEDNATSGNYVSTGYARADGSRQTIYVKEAGLRVPGSGRHALMQWDRTELYNHHVR